MAWMRPAMHVGRYGDKKCMSDMAMRNATAEHLERDCRIPIHGATRVVSQHAANLPRRPAPQRDSRIVAALTPRLTSVRGRFRPDRSSISP